MSANSTLELTQKQRKVIPILLVSRNITEACKAGAVGRTTLNRWLSEPLFAGKLAAAEKGILDNASRQLLGLQEQAINTLAELMDGAENESVRRAASKDILEFSFKIREILSFEDRITELERKLLNDDYKT